MERSSSSLCNSCCRLCDSAVTFPSNSPAIPTKMCAQVLQDLNMMEKVYQTRATMVLRIALRVEALPRLYRD